MSSRILSFVTTTTKMRSGGVGTGTSCLINSPTKKMKSLRLMSLVPKSYFSTVLSTNGTGGSCSNVNCDSSGIAIDRTIIGQRNFLLQRFDQQVVLPALRLPRRRQEQRRWISTETEGRRRITLALYRQVLQWCKDVDPMIPLSHFIPPIYMEVPQQIDEGQMKLLANNDPTMDDIKSLLHPQTIVEDRQLTWPIHTSTDVQSFFKAIFRLNAKPTSSSIDYQKQRISLVFEGLKSLNELTEAIIDLQMKRKRHMNRDGVYFRIGQVVKNKEEKWRGVIIGWERTGNDDDDDDDDDTETTSSKNGKFSEKKKKVAATSLTKKTYQLPEEDQIKYTIIVDSGDVHIQYSKQRKPDNTSIDTVLQSQVEPLDDPRLSRIRSTYISQYFQRFDIKTSSFLPNEILQYEYPNDIDDTTVTKEQQKDYVDQDEKELEGKRIEQISKDVITGVQLTAEKLRNIILGYTSSPEVRQLKLLSFFLDRLTELSNGNVLPLRDRLSSGSSSSSSTTSTSTSSVSSSIEDENDSTNLSFHKKVATLHLQQLHNFIVEVGELLLQKQASDTEKGNDNNNGHSNGKKNNDDDDGNKDNNKKRIKYTLGTIVRHKKYGFRGVIVAWDGRPVVDVSRWDGLQHIKDPHLYPFYHIIPDQNDCITIFGNERPSRYVCEENLELCPEHERTTMDVDLEPEWIYNHSDGRYEPPDDLKFKYGENLDDDGMTAACLTELKTVLTRILVAIRDDRPIDETDVDGDIKRICTNLLSMENHLIPLLQSSEDMQHATIVSECIKEIWKTHIDDEIRYEFDTALRQLLNGNTHIALSMFQKIVEQRDPQYAEAWNKVSTCEFMLGNMEASLDAAKKTIEYIPCHYQARNGMGLVHFEENNISKAIEYFRQSMELDPWSPVSARLVVCIDTLKEEEQEEQRN